MVRVNGLVFPAWDCRDWYRAGSSLSESSLTGISINSKGRRLTIPITSQKPCPSICRASPPELWKAFPCVEPESHCFEVKTLHELTRAQEGLFMDRTYK